jgi:hypothetical protein
MIFSGVEQDPTNYYAASIKEKVDNVNNERTMSVGRKKFADAQRARWANRRRA